MNYQIAIDGPSASGKSTIAKLLADSLGILYIDTGAMYRAITIAFMEQEASKESISINDILQSSQIDIERTEEGQKVYLNGNDVTEQIRSSEVTKNVSRISAIKDVRDYLVNKQQAIAEQQSVVMDGRDIGTVVLPHAQFKFYITASPEVRAQRRFNENKNSGRLDQTLEEMTEQIKKRDEYDMNREHGPLRRAPDSMLIDSTDLNIEEVLQVIKMKLQHDISPED